MRTPESSLACAFSNMCLQYLAVVRWCTPLKVACSKQLATFTPGWIHNLVTTYLSPLLLDLSDMDRLGGLHLSSFLSPPA